MSYDCVICLGPNDYSNIEKSLDSIKKYVKGYRNIYIITQNTYIESSTLENVNLINEQIFPFTIDSVNMFIQTPERAGWYLQQLLKLYATSVIKEMLDNFVIIDSDIVFKKELTFFEKNKIQFNVSKKIHKPYYDHMLRVHMTLRAINSFSGITHMMPMKRHIVQSLINMVEKDKQKLFWKHFLQCIDRKYFKTSGASEYEILFHYSLRYFKDECCIRQLEFVDGKAGDSFTGIYETDHWHMR